VTYKRKTFSGAIEFDISWKHLSAKTEAAEKDSNQQFSVCDVYCTHGRRQRGAVPP